MKKLFLLLLLVPIITFSQNEDELDDEYQEREYQEDPIPKLKDASVYKGLVAPILEGSTLIVYTASGNYELSRCTINSDSEVGRCSGKNFFVVQDNTTRFAIVYNHLCVEIGRVKLEPGENVAIIIHDGSETYDIQYDFKIINHKINMTKYYLKDGTYLFKRVIYENKDFDN